MASEVDICNLALSHLGDEANVSSIDPPDQSVQAQLCATHYPLARNTLLDAHNWSFTMRRVTLAQLTPETLEYEYCYAAPSDLSNMIALRDAYSQRVSIDSTDSELPDEYSLEVNSLGVKVIYCHVPNAELVYNAIVTNPGNFPPLFVEALSFLLASYLAGPIIKGDVGVAAGMKLIQAYRLSLSNAIASDAQNRRANRKFVPEAIRARQGLTGLVTGYSYRPTAQVASSSTSGTSGTSGTSAPPPADTTPPSAVTLSATAISAHQIDLTWTPATDNVGIKEYQIYRNDVYLTTVTGTSFSDQGLLSNTQYGYQIKALDTSNNSSLSNVQTASTFFEDLDAPTVPAGLTVTVISSTQIDLSWTASTDAGSGVAGYRVYRGGILIAPNVTGTSFSDTGLTPASLYSYTVSAFDNASNVSAQCAPVVGVTAAPPDTIQPSAPTSLTATVISSSRIDLSWTAATDNIGVTEYAITRNGVVIAQHVTGTSYSDFGLTASTAYTYSVQALDAAQNVSNPSNSATATTSSATDSTKPSVPTGLAGTVASASQVNLTWNASTDNVAVTGYRVYRTQTVGKIGYVGASISQYTVLGAEGLGSTLFWDDNLGYGGGGIYQWAQNLTNSNALWAAFDTARAANPTNTIWLQLCALATDAANETNANALAVVNQIKTRIPGVTVYVSSQPDYASSPCSIAGSDGPSRMATIRDWLISNGHCLLGPVFANLTSGQVQGDGCHQNSTGQAVDGQALLDFFQKVNSVQIADVATTSYNVTGLTPSTNYTFSVASYDAAGNISDPSSAITKTTSASTDTTAPTVPSNVIATVVSGTQINLAWTASTDAVGVTKYKVFQNGLQIANVTGSPPAAAYNVTGLTPGTAYTFTVSAQDAALNESTQSTPVSATTPVAANHPIGLYVLDKYDAWLNATPPVAIPSFIRGKLLRTGWNILETSASSSNLVYNFSVIDTALAEAVTQNKKLSLAIFAVNPPTYVKNGASATWNAGLYGTQPVPWDAFAKGQWVKFIQALAAHSTGGYTLPNHPNLANIDCGIIGSQGIRLVTLPTGYTLALYQQAVMDCVSAVCDLFPNKNCYVGLFGIGGQSYPQGQTDARTIRSALITKYDGTAGKTKICFYQETLTGKAPTTNSGSSGLLLSEVKATNDIMLQECWSYKQKIQNGTGTQCTWLTDAHGNFTDSVQASLDHATNDFNSKYIEIYADDAANSANATVFTNFNNALP